MGSRLEIPTKPSEYYLQQLELELQLIPETDLVMLDLFCGSGGSSMGAVLAGITVTHAANHSPDAIAIHNVNHPNTGHSQVDVTDAHPSWFPKADILWASPECTNHSLAKGVKRLAAQMGLNDNGVRNVGAERSRVMMNDVPRFMEYAKYGGKPGEKNFNDMTGKQSRGTHPYKYVVVENVVDVAKWDGFQSWCRMIRRLGYDMEILSLNTAFAHGSDFYGTPQSRDRLFVVAWHSEAGIKAPDLEIRPPAFCGCCDEVVGAVQTWKNGNKIGKYMQQYMYTCENIGCGQVVEPFALPAVSALDLTKPAPPIGDRKKPVKPATRGRVAGGIRQHWLEPLAVQVGGSTFERHAGLRTRPIHDPSVAMTGTSSTALFKPSPLLTPVDGRDGKTGEASPSKIARPSEMLAPTQTTRAELGVAFPPQLVPSGGTWRTESTPVSSPAPTRTTSETDGVAFPPAFGAMVTMRGGGSKNRGYALEDPSGTLTAGGNHQGLVRFPGATVDEYAASVGVERGDGQGRETVQVPMSWLVAYYGNTKSARSTDLPASTIGTVDTHGLVVAQAKFREVMAELKAQREEQQMEIPEKVLNEIIDASGFRMVDPEETKLLQGFPSYWQEGGAKRGQQRRYGNAVPPPASRLILNRIVSGYYNDMSLDRSWRPDHSLALL